MIKVKNKNGAANLSCDNSSWLKHWEKHSGETASECSNVNCFAKATLGGHVVEVGSSNTYIVPLCYACNNREDLEFYVAQPLGVPVYTENGNGK